MFDQAKVLLKKKTLKFENASDTKEIIIKYPFWVRLCVYINRGPFKKYANNWLSDKITKYGSD